MNIKIIVFILTILIFPAACTTYPTQTESQNYRARAETQTAGGVSVSAAVLSPQESENSFNVPLAKKNIQPVWLEIENREDKGFFLMLLSIDPDYFAPSEVAWTFRSYEEDHTDNESPPKSGTELFSGKHIPVHIPPHSTVSGYVYTNLDPGVKAFSIELISNKDARFFDFVQLVPGFNADFMRVDFNQLYSSDEIRELSINELRQYLEALPCCVQGGDRKTPGDPLNLVLIGDGRHIITTLVRQRWDLTETLRSGTIWRTFASSIFGSKYRTSPISSLYLFNRPQDIALQKARNTVDERNHMRLWRAPVTLNGKEVWVGQISRDIGIKPSSKTFITHKIDPEVDEARLYITMDIAASETLQKLGFVKGVGYSAHKAPRLNYTLDPFYTDGLRVVLIFGDERVPLDSIEYLPWELTSGLKKINKQ